MTIARVFGFALAAFAFVGPVWATGDPAAETATATTVPVKPTDITAVTECDPALAGSCPEAGTSAIVQPAATPAAPKLPPEDSEG